MFNFGKFFTKKTAITLDLTEIERNKKIFVRMKFRCTSDASKMSKSQEKKNQPFLKIFLMKS